MAQFFKEHRPLFLATLISLFMIPLIWKYAMLSDVPRLEKSRDDIVKIAREYAERVGFNTKAFDETIIPAQMQSPAYTTALKSHHTHLEMRQLIEQKRVDVPIWRVLWTQDVPRQSSQESMEITLTASGEILSMQRRYFDTISVAPLPIDSAKALAVAFLEREHGLNVRDTTSFTFISVKSNERKSFTIQSFLWHDQRNAQEAGVKEVRVNLVGTMIQSFSNEIRMSDAAREAAVQNVQILSMPSLFTFWFITSVMIYLSFTYLRMYYEGVVGVRGGTMIFGVVLILGTLSLLNSVSITNAYFDRDLSRSLYYWLFLTIKWGLSRSLNSLYYWLFLAISWLGLLTLASAAFFAWTIGESDARFNKRESQILGIDALLQKKFFSKTVGRDMLVGMAFGVVVFAVAILFIAISHQLLGTWQGIVGVSVSESLLPLSPFWQLASVISGNLIIRLLLFEWLLEKVKRTWLVIVVTGLVSTLYQDFPPLYPFWGTFVGGFIIGIVLSAFYVERGLLAVIVADFVYRFLFATIPFLLAPSVEFWGAGIVNVSVMIAVGIFAAAALQRGEEFSFKGSALPSHVQRISQRARMEEELKIARETQLRLLPQHNPTVKGLDISGICLPALEVGGDYYDYIQLPDEKLAVVIGDVSGKGVPAAMYMTLIKGVIQFASGTITEPKRVLTETNRLVCQSFKRGTFVSMIYAVIDAKAKTLRYARAGHNPLLLVSRNTAASSAPMLKGMALGLAEPQLFEKTLEETTVSLCSGDMLVLYTDGFSEAKNEDGEEYGEERLLNALRSFASKPTSREVVQAICKDVQRFIGYASQHDDMTMVVVKIR